MYESRDTLGFGGSKCNTGSIYPNKGSIETADRVILIAALKAIFLPSDSGSVQLLGESFAVRHSKD
jgi:hypothetical protein